MYNFLSAPNVSLNVRIHLSDFWLHDGALLVHGSFMTQAHLRVGDILNVSFDAARMNDRNFAWDMLRGVCGQRGFKMGPHRVYNCTGAANLTSDYSSVTMEAASWRVRITSQPIYNRALSAASVAPHHRLDIRITSSSVSICDATRGILGASFVQSRRDGATDVYPDKGEITTRAMGEGAIDGLASDYEMGLPYDTAFKFSKFGTPCTTRSATLNGPRDAATDG